MPGLYLLLPVYLLILSCMPCADVVDGMPANQPFITQAGSHNHENDAETCSPFCSCNCCGQRISNLKTFAVTTTVAIITDTKQICFQSFALQNVLQHIWQPPQLV